MVSYFKKYTSNDKKDIVLYKSIIMDLIKEIEANYLGLINQSTDILNIEYMTQDFLLEWLAFYGLDLPKTDKEKKEYNRNSLKRWRFFLRHRGEEQTLYSVLQSGGALFPYNKYELKLFWWDNVPEWIDSKPKDGFIYVLCEDRGVIGQNDLIDSVKPAGYTFDIVYNPSGSNFGVYPYYGDVRFDYGLLQGQEISGTTENQQSEHPNEYRLYKHENDGEKYIDSGTIFGNFGSQDYNEIQDVTINQTTGDVDSWTQFSISGYPAEFDRNTEFDLSTKTQTENTPRNTYNTAQLVGLFDKYLKYGREDDESEFIISTGHLSNRTTEIIRENYYFLNNDWSNDGSGGDGTISSSFTNINDYIDGESDVNGGFSLVSFDGIYMWQANRNASNDSQYVTLNVPYNTRLDGKIKINYIYKQQGSTGIGHISFYINGILALQRNIIAAQNSSGFVVLDCDEIQEPISEVKVKFTLSREKAGDFYVDFSDIELRKSILQRELDTTLSNVSYDPIVFHRNWSFETLYKNNLSLENIYNQYNKNYFYCFDCIETPARTNIINVTKENIKANIIDGRPCIVPIGNTSPTVQSSCYMVVYSTQQKQVTIKYKNYINKPDSFEYVISIRQQYTDPITHSIMITSYTKNSDNISSDWKTDLQITLYPGYNSFNIFEYCPDYVSEVAIDLSEFDNDVATPIFISKDNQKKLDFSDINKSESLSGYNPPQVGIQPENCEDGVYKYVPKNTIGISKVKSIQFIRQSSNFSLSEAKAVIDENYDSADNVFAYDCSVLWVKPDNADAEVVVLSESNYDNYKKALKLYWPFSVLPNGPATCKWWPPINLMIGLKHHWSFGNTSTFDGTDDVSTNPVNITDDMFPTVNGIIDKGIYIDDTGSNSKTTTEPIVSVDKDWSVSFWFRMVDNGSSEHENIISFGVGNNVFSIGAKNFYLSFAYNGTVINTNSYIADQDGSNGYFWYLITLTHNKDQKSINVYINDNNPITINLPDDVSPNTNGLFSIGFDDEYSWVGVESYIDELALWDRVLIPSEIERLYNNNLGLPFEYYSETDANLMNGIQHHYIIGNNGNFVGTDSVTTNPINLSNPTNIQIDDGKIGYGFKFTSANNGNCSATNFPAIVGYDKDWTVSFWCKMFYDSSSARGILTFSAGAVDGFAIGINSTGKLCFKEVFTNPSKIINTNIDLTTNWRLINITHKANSSYVHVYTNNRMAEKVDLSSFGTSWIANENYFDIGYNYDGGLNSPVENSLLDEISIWNRVITLDEIEKLYNKGKGLAFEDWGGLIPAINLLYGISQHWSFGSNQTNGTATVNGLNNVSTGVTLINDETYPQTNSNTGKLYSGLFYGGVYRFCNATLPALIGIDTDWTIHFWLRTAINDTSNRAILAFTTSVGNYCFSIGIKSKSMLFIKYTGTTLSTNDIVNTQIDIATDTFNSIALLHTANSNDVKVCINNQAIQTFTLPNIGNAASGDFRLGCVDQSYLQGIQYNSSIIDELSIWNRELISDELTLLYNNGNGLAYQYWNTSDISSLLRGIEEHWSFGTNQTQDADNFDGTNSFVSGVALTQATSTGVNNNASGLIGSCISLYTTTRYCQTNTPALIGADKSWTISFWIKTGATSTTANRSLFLVKTTAGDFAFVIGVVSLQLYLMKFDFTNNAVLETVATGATLNNTQFNHVVFTHEANSSTVNMYYNNVKTQNINLPSSIGNATTDSARNFRIGSSGKSNLYSLGNGFIDEVSIWSRALVDQEVAMLYNNGTGLSYSSWT